MKVYYINHKKSINILKEISCFRNISFLTLAVPFMHRGETLFDTYWKMSQGNILDLGGKLLVQYTLFNVDSINILLGFSSTPQSDAMNILLSSIR